MNYGWKEGRKDAVLLNAQLILTVALKHNHGGDDEHVMQHWLYVYFIDSLCCCAHCIVVFIRLCVSVSGSPSSILMLLLMESALQCGVSVTCAPVFHVSVGYF